MNWAPVTPDEPACGKRVFVRAAEDAGDGVLVIRRGRVPPGAAWVIPMGGILSWQPDEYRLADEEGGDSAETLPDEPAVMGEPETAGVDEPGGVVSWDEARTDGSQEVAEDDEDEY